MFNLSQIIWLSLTGRNRLNEFDEIVIWFDNQKGNYYNYNYNFYLCVIHTAD